MEKMIITKTGFDEDEVELIMKFKAAGYTASMCGDTVTLSHGTNKTKMKEGTENGKDVWFVETDDSNLIEIFKKYMESQKNRITQNDLDSSVFKNITVDKLKTEELGFIYTNKPAFLEFNNILKKTGITNVLISPPESPKFADEITLYFGNCSKQLTADDRKKFDGIKKISEINKIFQYSLLDEIESETTIDIKDKDGLVHGLYYSDRNIVVLNYNPFKGNYKDVYKDKLVMKSFELLTGIKYNKVNTDKIKTLLLANSFFSGLKTRHDGLKKQIIEIPNQINSLESEIVRFDRTLTESLDEEKTVLGLIVNGKDAFLKEVEKIRALPFVTKIELTDVSVNVTLKESTINIKNFRRDCIDFGKRKIYMGNYTISLKSTEIDINSDLETKRCSAVNGGFVHPHVSESHHPCFGDGDYRKTIFKKLSEVKLAELVTLITMWLKEYREDGAYVRAHNFYDDRLRCGYPVFDGIDRVELNDPKRLESGEQIKLEKDKSFNKIFDKFKSYGVKR